MGQQQYHEVSCISIHMQVSVAVPCQNLVCNTDYFHWGSKVFRGKGWTRNSSPRTFSSSSFTNQF